MPNRGTRWRASFAALLPCLLVSSLTAQQPARPAADSFVAALAALPASPPLGSGPRIVVLDGDGKPAPDAIVVFVARPWQGAAMQRWRQLLREHPGDLLAAVARLARDGTRHPLDAQAETRVPSEVGFVLAARGGTFALLRPSQPPKARHVLRLQPPQDVEVAVTGPDGAPAPDIGVGVREHGQLLLKARTGSDGRCTLRGIGADLPDIELLVGCKQPRRAPWPAAAKPIPFELPATTSLTAKLVGDTCPGADVQWRLYVADAGPAAIVEPATSDATHAHWPHVERGAMARVIASVGTIDTPTVEVQLDAAKQVEVVRDAKLRLCVLRLLDERGQPLRWRALTVMQKDGRKQLAIDLATSNGEGWVETKIGANLADTVRLTIGVNEGDLGTALLDFAEVEVPNTLSGRRVLGEVRVARVPIATHVQLRLPDGRPAVGVRMTIFDRALQHTVTDDAGVAAIRCLPPRPAQVGLGLAPGWFSTSEPHTHLNTSIPADGQRALVVQPACRVRVGVRGLPAITPTDFLEAEFRPEAGGAPLFASLPTEDTELMVPEGRWRFVVRTPEGTVLEIPDLVCTAGETLHDPRFLDFDWRAFACLARIRIEDANGRPVPDVQLQAVFGKTTYSVPSPHGSAALLLPKAGARLRVATTDPRLLPIDLGVVAGDRTVQVGKGPRLRWRPSQMPKLRPGHRLLLMAGVDHAGAPIDDADGTTLQLSSPGRIELMLSVDGEGMGMGITGASHVVDVPAAGIEFEFPMTDELRKKIEAESAQR